MPELLAKPEPSFHIDTHTRRYATTNETNRVRQRRRRLRSGSAIRDACAYIRFVFVYACCCVRVHTRTRDVQPPPASERHQLTHNIVSLRETLIMDVVDAICFNLVILNLSYRRNLSSMSNSLTHTLHVGSACLFCSWTDIKLHHRRDAVSVTFPTARVRNNNKNAGHSDRIQSVHAYTHINYDTL